MPASSTNLHKRRNEDEEPSSSTSCKRIKQNISFHEAEGGSCSESFNKQQTSNSDKEPCTSSNDNNINAYSVFPVHSLILSINSSYFKRLMSITGMQELNQKYIDVKVKKGEGRYVEMLINSFYDQDILKTMNISDLFKILELANQFLCDILIKCVLKLLETLDLKLVEECNQVLEKIKFFQTPTTSISLNNSYTSITKLCELFLTKYFMTVDCCVEKHVKWNELSFDSLLLLVTCGCPFVWHENSVMYFITCWLTADITRQTEFNIKTLMQTVRWEYITVDFLKDILNIDHVVLSKWSGFSKWYADCIIYHSISAEARILRAMSMTTEDRSYKNIASRFTQTCVLKLVPSVPNTLIYRLRPDHTTNKYIIYQGYKLSLAVELESIENSLAHKLKLRLYSNVEDKVENFYIKFEIGFGVFLNLDSNAPWNIFHDRDLRYIYKNFRPVNVEFKASNVFETDVGYVCGNLVDRFKVDGIDFVVFFKGEKSIWPNNTNLHVLNHSSLHGRVINRTFADQV